MLPVHYELAMAQDEPESWSSSTSSYPLPDIDSDYFDTGYDNEIFPPVIDADISKIHEEEREFILEGMVLLQDKPREHFNKLTTTGLPKKEPFQSLYNFIAVSLVRREEDVAAVAIYLTGEGAQVYYTKNKLEASDIRHAEQLCNFMATSAKEKPKNEVFILTYFEMLLQNGADYIFEKYSTIRELFNHTRSTDDKNTFTRLCEYLDSRSSDSCGAEFSSIDTVIAGRLGDHNTDDLYLNIKKMFRNIYKNVSKSNPTAKDLTNLSFDVRLILKSSPSFWIKFSFGDLCKALELFSQYAIGICMLYSKTLLPKYNWHWQNIHLHQVNPSEAVKYSLCEDSFWVSECIYFRHTGSPFRVTREQLSQDPGPSLPPVLEVTTPCEKRLIQYLIQIGQPATCLGISRPSCGLCMKWVESLNKDLNFPSPRWRLQGTIENIICQPMECPPETARQYIYYYLVRKLADNKRDIRFKWKNDNGKYDYSIFDMYKLKQWDDVEGDEKGSEKLDLLDQQGGGDDEEHKI